MRGAVLVVLSWVPPYWPFPHLVVLSSAAPGGFWPPGWHETPPSGLGCCRNQGFAWSRLMSVRNRQHRGGISICCHPKSLPQRLAKSFVFRGPF